MATRVLLLTQWFDPEPTFKGMVFARALAAQGFDVEVLTGFPNYPGGRLYPGYRLRLLQRETIEGIRVTRVPLYPSHDQSAIRRILNYASFALSATVYGVFMMRRCDVIYAYHPPLTVGVAAAMIRTIRRVPVVYDIQDMWPDTLRATGMIGNEKILHLVDRVCRWVYQRMNHIVVLSPGFQKLLLERGVPQEKLNVIYNWADEAALSEPHGELPATFPKNDRFRIVFAGNMGKAQALTTILDAAQLLQDRNSRVSFVLVGGGVEVHNLRKLAEQRQLRNVTFVPQMPMSQIGTVLNAADALLVHLRRDPLFQITIPSKTQAYMTVGKPLLMGVDGDAADLVRQANCGMVARSEDPEAIAAAAEALAGLDNAALQDMGMRAKRYYCDQLSLTVGAGRFGAIFTRLASRKASA